MKKIRNWMYIGLAVLIFNINTGSFPLLPQALGYAILTGCVRALQKEENSRHWQTMLGFLLTAYSLLFQFGQIQATVVFWSASVVYMAIDMLFFYGIATLLYQKRREESILLRRRNLIMIRTISIVAFCLELNLPVLGLVKVVSEWIYLLYLLLAILPLCKETEEGKDQLPV